MASLLQGDEWIVEIGIQSFFDTASHERLLAAVAEVVADGRILRLVQQVHQILEGQLGLRLHPQKTRVVHITEGFEYHKAS